MKNDYDRNWLENYKVIPKTDNAIYKNYQNPAMNSWDRQMASLSPAQKNRYNQFLNTIPSELQGLSAANMQKYLQDVDEKQNALAHERAG
jgi:flagellar biosynthesis chaperone FliJ